MEWVEKPWISRAKKKKKPWFWKLGLALFYAWCFGVACGIIATSNVAHHYWAGEKAVELREELGRAYGRGYKRGQE